jgi:hypothetical protein
MISAHMIQDRKKRRKFDCFHYQSVYINNFINFYLFYQDHAFFYPPPNIPSLYN